MVQAMQMVRASRIATVHRWCCGRTRKWRTCIACGFESTRRLGGSHQATQRRPSGCRATEGVACGCHTARELTSWLATERKTRRCPVARFLRVCGQLDLEARLPACLSLGKVERKRDEFVRASVHLPQRKMRQWLSSRRGASRQIMGYDAACAAGGCTSQSS